MLQKLKSVSLSVLPIVAVVLLIHFTMYEFTASTIFNFFIGMTLLVLGQVVFLTGLDASIVPMGEFVGNSVNDKKKFYIFVIFGLVFGIVSTIAEPDFQVLVTKISVAGVSIPKWWMLIGVGVGVGVMLAIGMVRIVAGCSLNIMLLVIYILIAVLSVFLSERAFAISLDAGAGTIGVITSPFLLALGIGVAKIVSHSRTSNAGEESFGLISLSSTGSLLSMSILFLIFADSSGQVAETGGTMSIWISTLSDCILSMIPLVIVFFIFEALFIKISWQEKRKLLFGSFVTFVGFYMFLFGIEFGLSDMGYEFGNALLVMDNKLLTIAVCACLGFFIVFCEPSIRNLAKQIEDVTNRNIKAGLVVVAIAISVILSIVLGVLRIYYEFSIWWIFGIGYGLIFILMPFVPKLFSAIAFDSGGVASGTLTVAFVLPIMMALAGNGSTGFGTIGIMVMTPVLIIEILGVVYKIIIDSEIKKNQKMLLRLSKTEDQFSNIEKLRIQHERDFDKRGF